MHIRAALLLLPLAACFGATEPLATDTGVSVEVGLWPIDPVEVEGQPSRTRPAAGALVVVRSLDGDDVEQARTNEHGVVQMVIAPGSYVVTVAECPGAMSLPKEDAPVDVTAGSFARATLTCDTGIR
jgi:hypothetical protein